MKRNDNEEFREFEGTIRGYIIVAILWITLVITIGLTAFLGFLAARNLFWMIVFDIVFFFPILFIVRYVIGGIIAAIASVVLDLLGI